MVELVTNLVDREEQKEERGEKKHVVKRKMAQAPSAAALLPCHLDLEQSGKTVDAVKQRGTQIETRLIYFYSYTISLHTQTAWTAAIQTFGR